MGLFNGTAVVLLVGLLFVLSLTSVEVEGARILYAYGEDGD